MFFVSEEFLRSFEAGDDFNQTIDQAVPKGEPLFGGDYESKASMKAKQRKR